MMRNKSIIPVLAVLILAAAWGCSRNNARIEGHVEGASDGTLLLHRLDINRTSFIDSLKIDKNGRFSYSTSLEAPELYVLSDARGNIINLLLAPDDQIILNTRADNFQEDYRVEGSLESENIRILVDQLQDTKEILDSLQGKARTIVDPQSQEMNDLKKHFARVLIQQKRFTIRYLVEHPSELSSVYALYQELDEGSLVLGDKNDLLYFKMVSDSVMSEHPMSSLAISLKADIEQRMQEEDQARQRDWLMSMADTTVSSIFDMEIPDREGNTISLSDLRGKVVLVTFWASWNEPSFNFLMGLKSTYKKYHDAGFEVYAISLDPDKIRWMKAIDFNEFDWINVCELSYPESRAATYYNVSNLPASFLVNREGEIMKRDLYGKQLETWLDNLL